MLEQIVIDFDAILQLELFPVTALIWERKGQSFQRILGKTCVNGHLRAERLSKGDLLQRRGLRPSRER